MNNRFTRTAWHCDPEYPADSLQLRESCLLSFRDRPALAAELIRGAFGAALPAFQDARIASAALTGIPSEYRADMVIELWADGVLVHAIIIDVQLAVDERKDFVWPVYAANLRARLECPVTLLVVTPHEVVAQWAARILGVNGQHYFTSHVLGPSGIPERR